jgi:hypothetical protein
MQVQGCSWTRLTSWHCIHISQFSKDPVDKMATCLRIPYWRREAELSAPFASGYK